MSEQRKRGFCAAGAFMVLLAVYLATMPGRIDIIDGQWRYEAAKNWLDAGEPSVSDPYLLCTRGQLTNPGDGKSYGVYNAAPSVSAMPFMAVVRRLPGWTPERDQFAFSLAGPFFGALLGALLVLGYGWLGIGLRPSLLFTALFSLTTLWWPASVTVFDQNQHAVLLLSSVLLAWLAGRRRSAALAVLAGLLGGLLLNYQESYVLLLPVIALTVLASAGEHGRDVPLLRQSPDRQAWLRFGLFSLGCCVGLGLFAAFNWLRFGSALSLGRYGAAEVPRWGSPVAGFLGLAISPGKGALWFSPPLLLAALGARRLAARAPALAITVAGVTILHLLLVIHLTFFGGDWCWGPRYLIPVMPLWALALPFGGGSPVAGRRLLAPLAAVGLLVQLMGISLDQHRFFYERNLVPSFWASDPWFYFRDSQLVARSGELLDTIRVGPPQEARRFTCSPSRQSTYCLFGPRYSSQSSRWMRQFQVFYLPRPWWGWMGRVRPADRPANPGVLALAVAALLASGGLLLRASLRDASQRSVSTADSLTLRVGTSGLTMKGTAVPSQE
jgi:hypothetical protein